MSEDLGLGDTNKIDSQTTEIVELQFVAGSEGMGVFFCCRFLAPQGALVVVTV